MNAGQLYRVTLALPPAYIDGLRQSGGQRGLLADVGARAAHLGFAPTLLETQDATDNRVVTLLTRRSGGPLSETDGVLRILRIEPVEEPPPGTEKADPKTHPFDPGLSVAEVRMVRHALAKEWNPRHLWGLASCMSPDFPVAASMLRVRKLEAESPPGASPPAPPPYAPTPPQTIALLRAKLDASAAREGIPADLVPEEVRRVAFGLAAGEPEESHPDVVALARCLLRPIGDALVVDRAALLLACPPDGEEGVTASSAIQLALATCKPEMSRVRSVGQVSARKAGYEKNAAQVSAADQPDTMRAQSAMMRSQKAIERQRWLRWYERDLST